MRRLDNLSVVCMLLGLGAMSVAAVAQTSNTAFTYQGQLKLGGVPIDGTADFHFTLWSEQSGGLWSGHLLSRDGVPVKKGLFQVELDFGDWGSIEYYPWLQIEVRSPAWDGIGPEPSFVMLMPRQRITPSPFALAIPGMLPFQNDTSVNLIGGWNGNYLGGDNTVGATISGGGGPGTKPGLPEHNAVTEDYGTVGGGRHNLVGDFDVDSTNATDGTIAGGTSNAVTAAAATVGGGSGNTSSGQYATIAGGSSNQATGLNAAVGGGTSNTASGSSASVVGGQRNVAAGDHSHIAGGHDNTAKGTGATVAGGGFNTAEGAYSFAAGKHALAIHEAAFVWADDGSGSFGSTGPAQFLIRATGGVGIGLDNPSEQLSVAGVIESTTGGFKFPDGSIQTTAGGGGSLWQTTGTDLYYNGGNVGIGYDAPNRKLYVLENAAGVAFPLKLDNPHPTQGDDGVGILFSTGGSGGGPVSPLRGKGALAYVYNGTWNRGDFHFLQDANPNASNPTLADSVLTIKNDGTVGIGTTQTAGTLTLGSYQGGTNVSVVQDFQKQLVLAGPFNTGANVGQSVKLLITEYDNDPGSDIYPIYVEDENNERHFYLRSQAGTKTAFFDGSVGIGTYTFSSKLTVNGRIESTSGGIRFPDGTTQTTAAIGGGGGWALTGNAGTTSTVHFLGTTDNMALSLRVNDERAFSLAPNPDGPNVVGGYFGNSVGAGVAGATISGGGGKRNSGPSFRSHSVFDDFGTIGGGWDNQAGADDGSWSDDEGATVSGGITNTASGYCASVGGGQANTASGSSAAIPGGNSNSAAGRYSFAAGRYASAAHDGSFVWADSTNAAAFASTAANQFLIKASGGVAIGTNNPGPFDLAVAGTAAKPGGGSWAVYSDARLKRNVKPLKGALERLLSLRGVTFEYKDPSIKMGTSGRQTGMIAQEVEQVFPEWVGEDSDGYKYIAVKGFEALLVEALRDLKAEKDARIAQLEERLAALEKQLEQRSQTARR